MKPTLQTLPLVDPHHHLWDLRANYYPWLTDRVTERVCGEYSAIRRDYLAEDFARDTAEVNLVETVHVQAECADPVAETAWLHETAEARGPDSFPHGVVAFVDLTGANAERDLRTQREFPRVVGIRQMLHEGRINPAQPAASPMDNPRWRENIGLLAKFNLSFDMQVYPWQSAAACRVIAQNPELRFVICHNGQPARRDEAGLKAWREAIAAYARYENVVIKISGVGMFDREWTVDSIRPFVRHTVETFGADRCMFASNFPVDGMMSSYPRLWRAYLDCVADLSTDEIFDLFSNNAKTYYLAKLESTSD